MTDSPETALSRLRHENEALRKRIAELESMHGVVPGRGRPPSQARSNREERYQRLFDSNIVGIAIANPLGRVLEANDYYLRLIGYTRDEYERDLVDWRALTPPEWIGVDEDAISQLREQGVCLPYEKEYVRRDGTRVPVQIVDAMLPGPGEDIIAFVL